MEPKSCLAALLLLAATFLPPLLSDRPAGRLLHGSDRGLLERIDSNGLRGGLPVLASPGEVAACTAAGCAFRPPRGAPGLLLGRPIDLLDASAAELQALPGIGPGLARRIVAARDRGVLDAPGGLHRVRGLGRRRVAALAGWARAGPEREASLRGDR